VFTRYSIQACIIAAAITIAPLPCAATVFHTRSDMLDIAFPRADSVQVRDHFLSAEQRASIERLAIAALDSDLVTVYEAYADGRILGFAILDTHVVRTLPETFLVVLSPEGAVTATHILAFHEPLEYMPSTRWLALLENRTLHDDLRLGRDIAGITGSTLSSRAVLGGVRRALAIYAVLLTEHD